MTDQLEAHVRDLLAARAAEVASDVAAGEAVIADRLRAGDDTVALVLPLPARPRRGRWLAAAAAVAVAVAGIAVASTRDDPGVTTGSSEQLEIPVEDGAFYAGIGTAEDVARSYLSDRLQVDPRELDFSPTDPLEPGAAGISWTRTDVDGPSGGVVGLVQDGDGWSVVEAFSDGPSIDVAERDADSVTIRTTGPAGSYVQLSVHLLTGEAITAGGCGGVVDGDEPSEEAVTCDLADEPIDEGDDPLTVRFSVVTQDGVRLTLEEQLLLASEEPPPTTADEAMVGIGSTQDESAKDVAERFTLDVFGVEYVTTDVQEYDGLHEVTLEGEDNVLVARVVFDEAIGRNRLDSVREGSAKLEPRTSGGFFVVAPAAGQLTITTYGGSPGVDLASAEVAVETTIDGPGTDHGPYDVPEHTWLRMDLMTDDGRVLRYFAAAGD